MSDEDIREDLPTHRQEAPPSVMESVAFELPQRVRVYAFDDEGKLQLSRIDEGPGLPGPPPKPEEPRPLLPHQKSRFLRGSEAAVYCRCGRRRLLDWERRGVVEPVFDPDGRRFFHVEELDRVMAAGPVPRTPMTGNVQRRPRKTSPLLDLPITYPRSKPRPGSGGS